MREFFPEGYSDIELVVHYEGERGCLRKARAHSFMGL
jgi:hypothetical protein